MEIFYRAKGSISPSKFQAASWIREFLRELESLIPPPTGQHHSLRFAQFGSDSEGWVDKLCLEMRRSNGSDYFFLEDQDLAPHSPKGCAQRVSAGMLSDFPLEAVPAGKAR